MRRIVFIFCLIVLTLVGGRAGAVGASNGPTISIHPGDGAAARPNAVSDFMYFVPLISPVPVCIVTDSNNSQAVQMAACKQTSSGHSFTVSCDMTLDGAGLQQNIFDVATKAHRHEKDLMAGHVLDHQLKSIEVRGTGEFNIEVKGEITNNVKTVTDVHLHYNAHGHVSPIWIELCDLVYANGAVRETNQVVARVNTLSFTRKPGPAIMDISVNSLKNKEAGDSFWQNFKGRVAGAAVNMFIPPLRVESIGNQAILDFGQALVNGSNSFTFPVARNLRKTVTPLTP